MRKLFTLMLAIMVACFCIPIVNASDVPSIKHYSVTNTTGSDAIAYISVATIIPGKHRLLGYVVSPITSGAGSCVGGLYDAISAGQISSANLYGEKGGVNTTPVEQTFPGPLDITNGVAVSQGAGTTVTIYYERSRP